MRWLIFAVLVLAGSARAQPTVLQEVHWQSAGANTWQAMYRAASAGSFPNIEPDPGGFARARSTSNIVLGSGVQVLVDRPITRSALAKTLTAGAKILPIVGTVIAGVEIAKEFGLWPTADGWFLDVGNTPAPIDTLVWSAPDTPGSFGSPADACTAFARATWPAYTSEFYVYSVATSTVVSSPGNTAGNDLGCIRSQVYMQRYSPFGHFTSVDSSSWPLRVSTVPVLSCAPPADGGDPITYRNGRCNTVSSGAGKSSSPDSVVEPAWDGILSDSTVDAIQLARNVQSKGWPLPTGAPSSSGPAEVKTGEKVTTGPEGTIVETIKQQLQYLGDKIIANAKVTNVQNTNITTGATTNTTSTSTNITTGADPEDPCTANPDRAGCTKLGEPEQEELPKKDVPLSMTPQTDWGPSTGSCPRRTASFLGRPIEVDFTIVCTGLEWLKPVVLAMASILAAYIFIGAIKS